eukprot:TRINITY_DN10858_c0_g1_i1.p1 TRINITY_DN10858_c0_g1~~TRINITY_DN10858_c0_g1_i1.p1  ORF type:complete len:512 (-),score=125.30 TRINITY_DN10858_c0_g1_i1:48-1583(-)
MDVVVIGAGLAGLRTTQLLEQQGFKVVLLEARDRVGGKTTGEVYDDYQWDLGGQWVGPTQDRMYKLLEELDMKTFPQNQKGKKGFMFMNGTVTHYNDLIPPTSWISLIDVQLVFWKLEAILASLPIDRDIDVWNIPEMVKYDAISVATWTDRNMWTTGGKNLLRQAIRAVFTVEYTELSMLFFIHACRSAGRNSEHGSFQRLLEITDGAQQDRIRSGSYTVSQKISKLIKSTIHLASPVRSIEQNNDHVIVTCENSTKFQSRYVVMACSPMLCSRISYFPPMPCTRDDLTQRFPMGKVIKCLAFYSENFWRKKGFSGEIVSQDDVITMGYEASLDDDSHPSLVGFIAGNAARHWSTATPEARRQAVLECFAKFFGEEALHPIHYIDKDWCSDPWSGGAYMGIAPPGVLTSVGSALRQPVGRIHFAGTETARLWNGYMEGALESAERVFDEISTRLQGRSPKNPATYCVEKKAFPWLMTVSSVAIVGVLLGFVAKANDVESVDVFRLFGFRR